MTPTLLVVDDDPFMHAIYDDALADSYSLVPAESAAEVKNLVEHEKPQLIILDVELPGVDGYEICRTLKGDQATEGIPVIFVSGKDRVEDRLKGYEAGGEDYVVKPIQAEEFRAKVDLLLKLAAERKSLASSAAYAASTAMTAMSSLGEMGIVIDALRKFNACENIKALADAMLSGLSEFGLSGAVQIRTPTDVVTVSASGDASPLVISVISQLARMERVLQYRNKLSISYDHASMLVDNLPLDNSDLCGRLRDHLAILVESADVRARSIANEQRANRQDEAIQRAVLKLIGTLAEIDKAQRDSHVASQLASHRLNEGVVRVLHGLAISTEDEEKIIAGVDAGVEEILATQASQATLQDQLSAIVADLEQFDH